jgi:ABC-type phosphate transport system auxiliary subunit
MKEWFIQGIKQAALNYLNVALRIAAILGAIVIIGSRGL